MDKAPDAFRTISEVADDLAVPQHVLRFWESRFAQIRPMKRGGGRRYYRPDDVDLLRGIHRLLYGEGYTIRGVQRILKEQGPRFVQAVWRQEENEPTEDTVERADAAGASAAHAVVEPRARVVAPAASVSAPRSGLSRDVLRQLRKVIDELGECRRIIDSALSDPVVLSEAPGVAGPDR
ncbi:MAG: MerR family transcriptional regulator [Proteobacteria bacterium]|nr:MerR family transcriptional regulator [Pseudomonadota bacterium]